AGTENELQAVVIGSRSAVDLPVTIERSKYFANIARRVAKGEAPNKLLRDLERFLADNKTNVWENSWVRFPRTFLSGLASRMLDEDLKSRPAKGEIRSDSAKFIFSSSWGEWVRIPISYLVKLALADVVGRQTHLSVRLKSTALSLLPYFSNDQTSPETVSFHI